MQISRNRHFCFHDLMIVAFLIVAHPLIHCRLYSQQAPDNPLTALTDDDSFHKSWQLGGFFTGGFVPSYQVHSPFVFQGQSYEESETVELNLFSVGFVGGKMLTVPRGPGVLRGNGEALVEVMPFWLADYPHQSQTYCVTGQPCGQICCLGPYHRSGASVTPFLLRWNFMKSNRSRAIPWAQLGGGLLWTNHKFPLLGGSTSVINFTPQVDAGESIFLHKNQSLDFAVKAVHISNASLGDNNPGLNVTLQFSVGYSWWK
jgi:lipid A 3-O-deacylase